METADRLLSWLSDNVHGDIELWDERARAAIRLLERAGEPRVLADALFTIGSVVDGRPGRTGPESEWAITCLRRSRDLWIRLGDTDRQVAATENLVIALENVRSGGPETVELLTEVLAHHERAGDHDRWAQTATNLSVILLRRGEPGRAVALCRAALPLRHGYADRMFTLINLAAALLHLARQRRSEHEEQAVEDWLGQELGGDYDLLFFRAMRANPMMFGLAEAPAGLHDLLDVPASGEAADLLREAVEVARAGIAAARPGDTMLVSRFARVIAEVAEPVHGSTGEAVGLLTAARNLIDARVLPGAALATAADLAYLLAHLHRWAEATVVFEDCLDLQETLLGRARERDATLYMLGRTPALARFAAYSHVKCGDLASAVDLLERTRARSHQRVRSTGDPVAPGDAATPDCPLAYVVTTPDGSVVLLVQRSTTGETSIRAFGSEPTSAEFAALFHNLLEPGDGLLTAQQQEQSMSGAVRRIAAPLGRVLQPVVDALHADGVTRLVIVPTGPTTLFPWAAATVTHPATGGTVPAGELLVLAQAPSATAARTSRSRAMRPSRGGLLAYVDPDRPDAPPLPNTRAEAAAMTAALGEEVTVRAGAEATREGLLRDLPSSRIAHLACHGSNEWYAYAAMRLLLAGGDVTLADLTGLSLPETHLVVLSACQTGHFDLTRLSDEMIGMPFVLLAAGAAAVVSTLWPVSDRVTKTLIGHFYSELRDTGDPASALHRAQRRLREGTYRNPVFWAGFVVHGW